MTTKRIEFRVELRSDNGNVRTCRDKRFHLAQRNAATAHNENVTALKIQFDGEKV